MANLTGQNAVQALAISNLRQTSPPVGSNVPTALIRADGIAQNGIPAYTTWGAAVSAGVVVGGAVIQFQANTAGGTQTFYATNVPIVDFTGLNFSSAYPLTVQFRGGDTFRIYTNANTVLASNSSYWIFDYSHAHLKIGSSDMDYHWSAGTTTGLPATAQLTAFNIGNSHHFQILAPPPWDVDGSGNQLSAIYGGRNYGGTIILGNCYKGWFQNLDIYLDGNNQGGAAGGNQAGDVWDVGGLQCLFEYCRVRVGGHDTISSAMAESIYAFCVFSNNWIPFNTGYAGSRVSSFSPLSRMTGLGTDAKYGPPYGPNLFYGCTWEDAAKGVAGIDYQHTKFEGYNNIVLGCYFLDNTFGSCYTHGYLTGNAAEANGIQGQSFARVAHNTGYNINGMFLVDDSPETGNTVLPTDFEQMVNCNNIWTNVNLNQGVKLGIVRWSGVNTALTSITGATYRNSFKGGRVGPNIICMIPGFTAGADLFQLFGTFPTSGWAFDAPPSWASSTDPISGTFNVSGNLRCTLGTGGVNSTRVDFTSVGTSPGRSTAGFTLTGPGTAAVGTAPGVTFATAGSSGTTVTVNDPWWAAPSLCVSDSFIPNFQNYFPYFGFGANATAAASNIRAVTSCNTTTKVWTLASAATVNNNDGIWFAGCGPLSGFTPHIYDNYGAAQ